MVEEAELVPYRLRCETVEFHNCLLAFSVLTSELEEARRENARLRSRIAELEGQW